MNDFWSKARGVTPLPRPSAPARVQTQAPMASTNLGLAVPPPTPQNQQMQQFYEQGYNDTHVPLWVREQPSQRCPNCNDANYLITHLNATTNLGHCWICGYSTNRRMSDGQVGNAMSPRSNAPATSTRQAHGMKNFGVATPNV